MDWEGEHWSLRITINHRTIQKTHLKETRCNIDEQKECIELQGARCWGASTEGKKEKVYLFECLRWCQRLVSLNDCPIFQGLIVDTYKAYPWLSAYSMRMVATGSCCVHALKIICRLLLRLKFRIPVFWRQQNVLPTIPTYSRITPSPFSFFLLFFSSSRAPVTTFLNQRGCYNRKGFFDNFSRSTTTNSRSSKIRSLFERRYKLDKLSHHSRK